MYLNRYCLRNFRRLENIEINLEENDTIFVGANNSGKTSATAAFRVFILNSDFKIHDFSAPLITTIDKFGYSEINQNEDEFNKSLPSIEFDLWFTISPEEEYGRVAHFLPSLQLTYSEVGVRICFSVNNHAELHADYLLTYPNKQKSLSYFLEQSDNLKKYFSLKYCILENFSEPKAIDRIDGQKTLDTLLRIDYVEAQRNIDDNNSVRSNRLSSVFADFYKHNLKQRKHDEKSVAVIDESNEKLTEHYENEFKSLINIIKDLGFPALNDRGLRVISNLSSDTALSGNTAITYLENETNHELPEAYNGLGFKNLIYIAIQIAHFQIQWATTENNRPLCQLIFIEEPEVHLHAQVQQTFIRKIRDVMKRQIAELELEIHSSQLVITTHSSHIIAEADFQAIRYFRRITSKYPPIKAIASEDPPVKPKAIASEVISLAKFEKDNTEPENIRFLKKYLALTHCDLFFADAAILVEGTVERLLLPAMIKKEVSALESAYLTILELGGAYAHRFAILLDFINLPTLVITDLDSVLLDEEKQKQSENPKKCKPETCRADKLNAETSNASIKSLLLNMKKNPTSEEKEIYDKKRKISSLIKLTPQDKICSDSPYRYVTFQQAVPVSDYGDEKEMIPRTFEEAFIYENIKLIKDKKIDAFIKLKKEFIDNFDLDYQKVYATVKSNGYKKSEFALNIIYTEENWKTPTYIVEGLNWLAEKLELKQNLDSSSEESL
ncbi:MAG: AAA family ATPase [Methylococcaceae bacterium]